MKFATLVSLLAALTAAANGKCISQSEANTFIDAYIGVYTKTDPNFTKTAKKILTKDFTRISTSINMLLGRAPDFDDGVNFRNRATWIANLNNSTVPPTSDITTLDTVVACDKILWYWNFGQVERGNGRFAVEGGILFTMTRAEEGLLKAKEAAIEFNSLAWALDVGFTCNYPNGTQV